MFSVDSFFLLPVHIQHVKNKQREKWTLNVAMNCGLFCYQIRWQSTVFIMQWNCHCAKRIQHVLISPAYAFTALFQTQRGKKMIRKSRNFKMKYLITTEFLQGNSLAIQWLGLGCFTAMGPESIPGRGTKLQQAVAPSQNQKKKIVFFKLFSFRTKNEIRLQAK